MKHPELEERFLADVTFEVTLQLEVEADFGDHSYLYPGVIVSTTWIDAEMFYDSEADQLGDISPPLIELEARGLQNAMDEARRFPGRGRRTPPPSRHSSKALGPLGNGWADSSISPPEAMRAQLAAMVAPQTEAMRAQLAAMVAPQTEIIRNQVEALFAPQIAAVRNAVEGIISAQTTAGLGDIGNTDGSARPDAGVTGQEDWSGGPDSEADTCDGNDANEAEPEG